MTAPLFFVAGLERGEHLVALSPDDSRHALRSLRLTPGSEIILAEADAWVGRGRIADNRDGIALVEVLERAGVEPPPGPSVGVRMSPPKGERLWWAVQKLAEVGIDRLDLMNTERVVRSWTEERVERVEERMRSIAREAAMQSRQPRIMKVGCCMTLKPALGDAGPGSTMVLLHQGAAPPLSRALPGETAGVGTVTLIVGPEGGFTDREVEEALEAGATVASLGPAILRTETAAIVAASLVLARYGRLG